MMAKTSTETRDRLTDGGGGGHTDALLQAARSGNVRDLIRAYGRADSKNRARYEKVFPGIATVAPTIYNDWPSDQAWGIYEAFPDLPQAE